VLESLARWGHLALLFADLTCRDPLGKPNRTGRPPGRLEGSSCWKTCSALSAALKLEMTPVR